MFSTFKFPVPLLDSKHTTTKKQDETVVAELSLSRSVERRKERNYYFF